MLKSFVMILSSLFFKELYLLSVNAKFIATKAFSQSQINKATVMDCWSTQTVITGTAVNNHVKKHSSLYHYFD